MLKKSLLAVTVAASIFAGCSSAPTDAKGVAVAVCESTKKMDFAAMKQYAVPALHQRIDQAIAMMGMLKAMPQEQQDAALARMEKIDCSAITVTDGANGSKEARMKGEKKAMILQQVEGQWKIAKL